MHPIITRELRTAVRKQNLLRARFIVALSACGLTVLFMLLSLIDHKASVTLEHFLFYGALLFSLPQALEHSISLFTEERQNLGLLILTGMNSFELFSSKLGAGLLVSSSKLLAAVPLFAIPFLAGGVSRDQFLASVCCLPVLLLLTVAIGIFASILCREQGTAMVVALGIATAVCGATTLPYMLGKQLAGTAPYSAGWLTLSPAFGVYAIGTDLRGIPIRTFWLTWAIDLAWTMAFLIAAATTLRRTWQDDPGHAPVKPWSNFFERLKSWDGAGSAKRRIRILSENPFQWLVESNSRPVVNGWIFVGCAVSLWIIGWAAWPHHWPSVGNFLITALVLVSVLRWLCVHATAGQFGEERRSGRFELLLTTPLTPEQIIDGYGAAMHSRFDPLRKTVFALCVVMMLGGFFLRPWNFSAVFCYILIWIVILVCCLHTTAPSTSAAWIALNTGRTAFAVMKSNGGGWHYLWVLYNIRNLRDLFGRSASGFPTGSTGETVGISFLFVVSAILYFSTRQVPSAIRKTFITHMRQVAQYPIPDPHDPRLKKWDWKEPLPPALHCDPLKV